ncbi:MAG: cytochrome c-type biosis protein CcdA [Thermoleophilia bacterium]|nr:cytochrome c-type biosis protein CcdA [Thermoleophilia bacterium]
MDLAGLSPAAALAVSAAAGAASFLSPCVAPLLPGYVAFVAGPDAGAEGPAATRRTLARAGGFVLGFVVLFAALGATAAAFSRELVAHRGLLELVSGLLVALLGIATLFDRSPIPTRASAGLQRGAHGLGTPGSALAAMPVGAAFAVAWSPCIGPALAGIVALAAGSARPAWGATLLVAYGLGLGVPFLAGAFALARVQRASSALRRHARIIRLASGVLLLVLGVAIATGGFGQVTARLARSVPGWLV